MFEPFNSINYLRVAFNDYRASYFFKDHPNYLSEVNLSANDIMLFGRGWFFADPQITNIQKLSYLSANYIYTDRFLGNFGLGIQSLRSIFSTELLPLLLVLVVGVIFLKNRKIKRSLLVMLGIFVVITFIIGVLGRSSQLRIYYPCVFLLCIMVSGISSWMFYSPLYNTKSKLELFKLRLHDVGYYSIIPMPITYKQTRNNKNPYFMEMFSGKNVHLINPNIDWLKIYCQEHYNMMAEVEAVPSFKYLNMVRFKCGHLMVQ